MISSQAKNRIYAFASILAIFFAIGSFALVTSFLMKINTYVFSVDDRIVKDQTTVMDAAGYDKIKTRLGMAEGGAEIKIPEITPEIPEENAINASPTPQSSPEVLDETNP